MLCVGALVFAAGLAAGQVFTWLSDRPEIQDGIMGGVWNGHFLTSVEKNQSSTPCAYARWVQPQEGDLFLDS
jgi:hypothetical protein